MIPSRDLDELRCTDCAARQLGALETVEFGIGSLAHATWPAHQRELLDWLRERPLAPAVVEARDEAAAMMQKQLRFALSRHFLERFWGSQGGRLIAAWRGLATERYEPSPGDVVLAIERHFQPSSLALQAADTQHLIPALARSLELLFDTREQPGVGELQARLRALTLPLIASTWFAALDWQAAETAAARDHTWPNYLRLLSSVEDHYASPAVHYRAGVEGYCALIASMLQHVATVARHPAELVQFIRGDARANLAALAGRHMLSLAAVDEECRAAGSASVWTFASDGRSLLLTDSVLPRIVRRMHELRGRSNTRAGLRLGCPFMSLRTGFSDLHVEGFGLLARRWLEGHAALGLTLPPGRC